MKRRQILIRHNRLGQNPSHRLGQGNLDRLEGRGLAREDAEARMAAQAGDAERRAIATHVVDNSGDEAALARRVDELWSELTAS